MSNLLAASYLCSTCVTNILRAHRIVNDIRYNYRVLQKYLNIISGHAEHSITMKNERKQLMLTVDNVMSLNVPCTVTVAEQNNENGNETQIFLCEVDDLFLYNNLEQTNHYLKYECPYCGKQINDYQLLKTHLVSHSETAFKCPKCAKKFSIFDKYINHRDKDHSESISFCSTCQIIVHGEGIEEHENIHNNQTFICDTCKETFMTKSALERHISTIHVEVKCQYCIKDFSNEFKLNHHRCLFKCLECVENCIHEEYLVSYREQYLAMEKKFKCIKCDFNYLTRSELICHINEEHLLHFPYLCDLCGDGFPSKPHLTAHMYKKHVDIDILNLSKNEFNEYTTECDQCGDQFDSEVAYCKHMRKHLSEQAQCLYCLNTYSNIARLNLHVKIKHPEEVNSKSFIYQCTMCPEDFNSRPEFLNHIASHPEGTEHKCRTCGDTFPSKNVYFSHVRKHTINYDRECPICFKKYTKHTIARHLKSHMRESKAEKSSDSYKKGKRISCDVCGVSLHNEKALIKHSQEHSECQQCVHCNKIVSFVLYKKHLRTHNLIDDKRWKVCKLCPYKTKFSVCLEAHVNRFHLKIRPYQCTVCKKNFYSDYTLKGHLSTHNSERPELYCHICGNKFISKKALVLHTRLHTGEKPYPCELCEQRFLSASRRRQHMIRKHFEPSVECELCQKKFYTKSDLRRHVGDCHGEGEVKRKKGRKSENVQPSNVE